jgi:glutamate-ammonia-ligase adenylyltransferase
VDIERLGAASGLRRFRRRASYRLAARDLAGARLEEVVEELTAIAEACLRIAVQEAAGTTELSVIGMGKLGGAELNYSSDVDVLFVHPETGPRAQDEASRAAAALSVLLSEATADGVALRVDPNLRPEGRSGPLSRSLPSMLDYYERHAATWERQALLKARPVAGVEPTGRAFVEAVVPFVYPAVLPSSAIDDVRATKARIEEVVRARGKESVELKRGRGGIRDVEFAVQLLQLVHGRRHEHLRVTGTLPALHVLAEEGFVAPADAEALADSYRFLRRLEHRLQMVQDRQTHELPTDRAALGPLARAMGLEDAGRLQADHERHTAGVRSVHERLFYRPLMEVFGATAAAIAPAPAGRDRTATEELLAGLGFVDRSGAYDRFAVVLSPATRLGKVVATLFPIVAPALSFAANPDAALVRFERVIERVQQDERLSERLAETLPDHPDGARRLAALVAVSSAFADMLVSRPSLVTVLLEPPTGEPTLFPVDPQSELVRVAGAAAAGDLRSPDVGRRLAMVAGDVVARAIEQEPPDMPLAVIGMGKFGGEDLGFGSDLDLMLVYEGEGPDDFRWAAEAAERILEHVRAAGWIPDPDLRPEGRNGPLVRSMASYLEYWQRWAETWEYQALLRARWVAGDERLGRRFVSNAADLAYPEVLTREQVVAIRRMRVRMEEERVRPPEARRFHFKLGYGSLADVQFAVELAQMRFGFDHPAVRGTNILEALQALSGERLVEDSVALALGEAWTFLSEIKNALEIERRLSVEAVPPGPEAQAALARRLGYAEQARHRFLQDYQRITRRARSAMERVFYGGDE